MRFQVLALITAVAFKAAALMALDPVMAARVLIGAHTGARFAAVAAMSLMPYAGDAARAKATPLTTGVTTGEGAVAAITTAVIGVIVLPPLALALSAALGLAAGGIVANVSSRRIGGVTGDVLGAIEQVFEATFMVVAAAVISGPG